MDMLINGILAAYAPTASLMTTAAEQLALDRDGTHMAAIRQELRDHAGFTLTSTPEQVEQGLGDVMALPYLCSFVRVCLPPPHHPGSVPSGHAGH
mmetsp:Transcript_39162/g.98714  ORF Transcript_39162/g.98714 Transcript_39162/m.98714 type:complete len:95 (-) Transcript_39162:357-641(-)